jgi:hypothetical protein
MVQDADLTLKLGVRLPVLIRHGRYRRYQKPCQKLILRIRSRVRV